MIEDICDPEYYKGRNKYPITAIVYTAFNVEEQNIPGFEIQKVLYSGNRLYLPELYNDQMIIEVFSDGSNPCMERVQYLKHVIENQDGCFIIPIVFEAL